jgi:hypothetical protein
LFNAVMVPKQLPSDTALAIAFLATFSKSVVLAGDVPVAGGADGCAAWVG